MSSSCVQVSSDEALRRVVEEGKLGAVESGVPSYDLVLADYNLPGMDFFATLDYLLQELPGVPVITVSSPVGEERAVEMLKRGVADFVLKGNLDRLVPAIVRSMREGAAQREKAAAEARLIEQASWLDEANDAILVRDLKGTILFWNKAAQRQYGWTSDEAIGRHVADVLYPESRLQFEEAHAILVKQGDFSGRVAHFRRDGSKVAVQSHWIMLRDELGRPKSILAIYADLTDRIALEEQLFHAQKLEALGQLTGGVAHDFNNLLTVILGCAELIEEQTAGVQECAELHEMAQMIQVAGHKGAELTRGLLAFARRQMLEPELFSPAQVLGQLEPLIRRSIGEHIELRCQFDDDIWMVRSDLAQFESALLNLCINARDAMRDGGMLQIELCNVTLDKGRLARSQGQEVRAGDYVLIRITDSGEGMTPEVLSRAFEPFFTTKGADNHTGLGLSMVYGFAMQAQGYVQIDSTPGQGTSFELYLPRSLATAESTLSPRRQTAANAASSEHILLVEDNDMVRSHAASVLRGLGYVVKSVDNARLALDLLGLDDFVCDLLFTDVVMRGGMNGLQLAAEARRMRPDIRVLFTSGYMPETALRDGGLEQEAQLLQKPYSRQALASKVALALATKPLH